MFNANVSLKIYVFPFPFYTLLQRCVNQKNAESLENLPFSSPKSNSIKGYNSYIIFYNFSGAGGFIGVGGYKNRSAAADPSIPLQSRAALHGLCFHRA